MSEISKIEQNLTIKKIDNQTVNISITEVNDAPYVSSIEDLEVPLNSTIVFDLENYLGEIYKN